MLILRVRLYLSTQMCVVYMHVVLLTKTFLRKISGILVEETFKKGNNSIRRNKGSLIQFGPWKERKLQVHSFRASEIEALFQIEDLKMDGTNIWNFGHEKELSSSPFPNLHLESWRQQFASKFEQNFLFFLISRFIEKRRSRNVEMEVFFSCAEEISGSLIRSEATNLRLQLDPANRLLCEYVSVCVWRGKKISIHGSRFDASLRK